MKKIFLPIVLLCLLSTIFTPFLVKADTGLVQCGNGSPLIIGPDGKPTNQPNPQFKPCGILDFFGLLAGIYTFIVKMIATPLAVVALAIGGIFMLISAGNPNLMGMGKKIIYAAIIGLALVWGSWLIIDFVLKSIGFVGNWSTL